MSSSPSCMWASGRPGVETGRIAAFACFGENQETRMVKGAGTESHKTMTPKGAEVGVGGGWLCDIRRAWACSLWSSK